MKIALNISVLLNLGLLVGLVFAWPIREKYEIPAARPIIAQSSAPLPAAPGPATARETEPVPFRWNQLDSTDYRIYVKNLRSIGCPEGTLRAIVTADVDLVFQDRNHKLEQQLTDLAGSSWSVRLASGNTEQSVRDEMSKLPGEESEEIDDLLGVQHPPMQTGTVASSSTPAAVNTGKRQNQRADATTVVSIPLVLQNVDISSLALTDEQMQAIDNLRQDFVNKIGGTNQDPNDPAYLARWQQNQPAVDSMLRVTMGGQAYARYLVLQNQQANQGSPQQ